MNKISVESSLHNKAQEKVKEWSKIVDNQKGKEAFELAMSQATKGNFDEALETLKSVPRSSSFYSKATLKTNEWQKIIAAKQARTNYEKIQIKVIGLKPELAKIFQETKSILVSLLQRGHADEKGVYLPATVIVDYSLAYPMISFWGNTDTNSFKISRSGPLYLASHQGLLWAMGSMQLWHSTIMQLMHEKSEFENLCRIHCKELSQVVFSAALTKPNGDYFRQFAFKNKQRTDAIFFPEVEIKLKNQSPVRLDSRKTNLALNSFVFVLPSARDVNGQLNVNAKAYQFFGIQP